MIDLGKYKDASEVFMGKHMTYEDKSPEEKLFKTNEGKMSAYQMIDKIRKNHGYTVHSTSWNPETKSASITILVTKDGNLKQIEFSYKDILKELNWKSFKVLGLDTVEPNPLSPDEVNALYLEKIEATKKRDLSSTKKPKEDVQ